MRTTRIRFTLFIAVLAIGLMAPAAVPAAQLATEPVSATDNLEHVTNVQYPQFREGNYRATDSDFLTFEAPDDWTPPTWGTAENGLIEPEGYEAPAPGDTRHFNLMGTRNNGLLITDITDPENPVVVSRWDCAINQADVYVFQQEQEDGSVRQYVAFTLDATASVGTDSECATTLADRNQRVRGQGTFIGEVTDPYRPQTVSFLEMRKGTHQTTVHPSGDYVYNSAAVVAVDPANIGTIEVFDVSDPWNPELAHELHLQTGLDSHDMTFDDDGDRLYVAALTHSFVIDTSDPAEPTVVSRIFDPAINIHHDAHAVTVDTPAGEQTFMLIGDELAGAIGTGTCPGGGIHVYNITGPLEAAPVKMGAFFIPEIRATPADVGGVRTCTAHVIQPLPGTTLLSVAWYNGGVRILDYGGLTTAVGPSVGALGQSAPLGIQEVGHMRFADSSLWSAKVHEVNEDGSFYIYGGDMSRHLDVFRFNPDGEGTSSTQAGEWLTPQQALNRAAGITVPADYTAYCMLG